MTNNQFLHRFVELIIIPPFVTLVPPGDDDKARIIRRFAHLGHPSDSDIPTVCERFRASPW